MANDIPLQTGQADALLEDVREFGQNFYREDLLVQMGKRNFAGAVTIIGKLEDRTIDSYPPETRRAIYEAMVAYEMGVYVREPRPADHEQQIANIRNAQDRLLASLERDKEVQPVVKDPVGKDSVVSYSDGDLLNLSPARTPVNISQPKIQIT